MKVLDYKPQIDGLRAFAVLPVIFFHADFNYFEGGFVGVDIFFVISGYLITNIIIKDLSEKKFNLKNFYLRRARRILPILLFITIISLFASLILMTDEQLKFFSKQVFSVVLFFSNFFFWKNSNYFDPNSEIQPLLHTWSLGVEEQFYILFPLFLILVWTFFKKKLILIIIILTFLSLFLSQFGGNFKYHNISIEFPYLKLPFDFFWQAGAANFYLPFGRAWELLIGSLLSIFTYKKEIKDQKSNDIFGLIGMILILISIFTYSDNLQYPSIFTVLPVVGTVLLIIYSTKKTFFYKILSFKPLVFFGLISFSLYLWHQPLLAFNRIHFGVSLNLFHKLIIIFATFFLSVITWKFIEKPFRNKNIINNKKLIITLLSSSFFLLIMSILILNSKISSLQKPLSKNILNSFKGEAPGDCFDLDYAHLDNKKWYCEIGSKSKNISFAVIGDSHALSLKPAFDKAGILKNKKGIFTGISACPGLLGITSLSSNTNIKNCNLLNKKLFKFIKERKIKQIFLASRWTYYTVGDYSKSNFSLITKEDSLYSNRKISKLATIHGVKETLSKYQKLNVNVIFIHQVPEQIYNPKYVYQKSIENKKKEIDLEKISSYAIRFKQHMEHQKFIRNNLDRIKKDYTNLKEIDFDNIFCNNSKCFYGSKNTSYYTDQNHLSINGAMKTVNKIKSLIE